MAPKSQNISRGLFAPPLLPLIDGLLCVIETEGHLGGSCRLCLGVEGMLFLVKGQGLFKAPESARLLWGSRSAPCDYSVICQVAWCVRAVAGLHLHICHP